MISSIHFLFCLHNHQPEGNFDHVFEEAYQKAYLPMLEAIERHRGIRLAQHFSGILLEWLEDRHSDFLDRYRELVSEGRVEILTGGYFEPILPSIPDRDKLGQIKMLTETVRERFDYEPRGLWVAERVWEPYLPKPLAEAGVKYVPVDDAHFKINGLRDEDLVGYFNTEEQGSVVSVFPVSERLRYLIPFQPPRAAVEYLLSFGDEAGERMLMMGDDGEKFGVWPGTHDSVYRQGWLENFFELLETHSERIRMITPAEYHEQFRAIGNIYLPTASYREMMEWALAPDDTYELERAYRDETNAHIRRFLRGGYWRNFLVKYPESNNAHKKMLWIGEKIDTIRKDPKAKKKALNALWRGQCNCAYWHGVFGGLYLNFLRTAVFRSLIEAERIADRALHKSKKWVDVIETDFLRCGSRCVIVSNPEMVCHFQADCGASLFELDLRQERFNLLNTLSRRKEAYHRKLIEAASKPEPAPGQAVSIHDLVISKEEGLEKYLHYDWYRRTAAIDHFLEIGTDVWQLQTSSFTELGDFVNQPYDVEIESARDRARVLFHRDGRIWRDGVPQDVRLEKEVKVGSSGRLLPMAIRIKNTSDRPLAACYASEWGFALNAGNTPDRYYIVPGHNLDDCNLASTGTLSNITSVIMVEEWIGIDVELGWDIPATLWRFPIETIGSSEAGFERCYQSSVVMPGWDVFLDPGESWAVQLELVIRQR